MEKLGREFAAIELKAMEYPHEIAAGEIFWVRIVLTNNSSLALVTGAPFPINLSYHWREEATGDLVRFEGERTAILPAILPGTEAEMVVLITAPSKPGPCICEVTAVQENVSWFEEVNHAFPQRLRINVKPQASSSWVTAAQLNLAENSSAMIA
jgi:hypothetical protein